MTWSLLVPLLLVLAGVAVIYNRLVRLHQNVRESWAAIDTELKRRYDLVPNLVETVRGYAGHENQTLQAVVAARSAAIPSPAAASADPAAGQNGLTHALRNLFVLAEDYPQLKADKAFTDLQHELEMTETRISQSRRFYNANVRAMNTAVQSFPISLVAAIFGYKPQPYFEMEDPAQRSAPSIKFDA